MDNRKKSHLRSPFKNAEKELLKSYNVNKIDEKYANYRLFKQRQIVHARYDSDLNYINGYRWAPYSLKR